MSMNADSVNLGIKSKIWIEDSEGQVVFGAGRLYILGYCQVRVDSCRRTGAQNELPRGGES